MARLFFIADLSDVGRKKTFFYFMAFNPFQAKKKQNIPITNVKKKAFLKKRH